LPIISVKTSINAPIAIVFDLARSIDFHQASTVSTNEKAIAGKTEGLISLNETVTWRAKHFGIYQNLEVKIVEFNKPNMFKDIMLNGAFKSMDHTHSFKQIKNTTEMQDLFSFESPLGLLGKIANHLFLKNYMRNFLINRNSEIKKVAESEEWKSVLNYNNYS